MKLKLKIEKEFDVKFLQVEANVRYWEDAEVNGVEDVDGSLIPCKDGEIWKPLIDVEKGIIQNWTQGVKADIHYKVCDDGKYTLLDENREEITMLDDYVIDDLSIGESGYGDYIIMKIDEDGKIEDWNPTFEEFKQEE